MYTGGLELLNILDNMVKFSNKIRKTINKASSQVGAVDIYF